MFIRESWVYMYLFVPQLSIKNYYTVEISTTSMFMLEKRNAIKIYKRKMLCFYSYLSYLSLIPLHNCPHLKVKCAQIICGESISVSSTYVIFPNVKLSKKVTGRISPFISCFITSYPWFLERRRYPHS